MHIGDKKSKKYGSTYPTQYWSYHLPFFSLSLPLWQCATYYVRGWNNSWDGTSVFKTCGRNLFQMFDNVYDRWWLWAKRTMFSISVLCLNWSSKVEAQFLNEYIQISRQQIFEIFHWYSPFGPTNSLSDHILLLDQLCPELLHSVSVGLKNDRKNSGGTLRQKETKRRRRRKREREKREKKEKEREKKRDEVSSPYTLSGDWNGNKLIISAIHRQESVFKFLSSFWGVICKSQV